MLSDYPQALDYYQQSLAIKRDISDHYGEGVILGNIGLIYQSLGDYLQALDYYQQFLVIKRDIGDLSGEGLTLNNIGIVYDLLGDYFQALEYYEQSLAIKRDIGDRLGKGTTLINMGQLHWRQSKLNQALKTFQEGLRVEERLLAGNLIVGSEAQKQTYLTSFRRSSDMLLSLHLQHLSQSSDAAHSALTTVLQRKGLLLDLFTNAPQSLRQRLDPEGRTLLDKLNRAHTQLSQLTFQPSDARNGRNWKSKLTTCRRSSLATASNFNS